MARLVLEDGRRVELDDDAATMIGRQYPIGRDDKLVSRRHALVRRDGDAWFIEDVGSTSGTYVNDVNIVRSTRLRDGDAIRCGGMRMRFEEDVEPPAFVPLLDAVRAAPDDDAPRLVYADALAEAGDARGEMIQVDVAVGKTPRGAAERATLIRRRAELVVANPAWYPVAGARFARGFVERFEVLIVDDRPQSTSGPLVFPREVTLRGHHAPGLLKFLGSRAAPTIEDLELRLNALGPSFDLLLTILATAVPPRLRGIKLRGNPSTGGLRVFTSHPRYASLERLTIDTQSEVALPAEALVGKKRVALRGAIVPSSVAAALRRFTPADLRIEPALAAAAGVTAPPYEPSDDRVGVHFATDDDAEHRAILDAHAAARAHKA
jgi:uncharacterized protein (TIGR02996 family)